MLHCFVTVQHFCLRGVGGHSTRKGYAASVRLLRRQRLRDDVAIRLPDLMPAPDEELYRAGGGG